MSILGEPLTLRCGAVIPNRLSKAAMTEGLADAADCATEEHSTLYATWSHGGSGLLITGNVMVDRRFLERPGNVVIDDNGGIEQLKEWATAGTRNGNHLWMQISHPGRQCNLLASSKPLAPSPVRLKLGKMFGQPIAMTGAQIEDAIQRYVKVAQTAKECGFTGVQIHAAHGYLISQFLSPLANQRDDQWGGSLENRARFLMTIVNQTRETLGSDFPIAVKLNSADFQKGGFSQQDSIQVAQWLDQASVDLLEISGGTYEQPQLLGHQGFSDTAEPPKRESTKRREAYFLEYAKAIRAAVDVPLMVTGGFRSRSVMESAIESGDAQIIGLARPLCVDPNLPNDLLSGSLEVAGRYEDNLVLGPGFLGPTSELLLFKIINVQGGVVWFYKQIEKLARGEQPNPKLGLLRGFLQHTFRELSKARKRKSRG